MPAGQTWRLHGRREGGRTTALGYTHGTTRSTLDEGVRPARGQRYDDISRRTNEDRHDEDLKPDADPETGNTTAARVKATLTVTHTTSFGTDNGVTAGIDAIALASATVTQIKEYGRLN